MKISILGIGAYGIALSRVFYENNNEVIMWSRTKEEADNVLLKRENIKVLPGVKIPKDINIITDMQKCIKGADVVVLAVPMRAVREVSKTLSNYLTAKQVLCLVSKGIEENTNKLMSQIVFEQTGSLRICMLSGPSFAVELGNYFETGFVVASDSEESCKLLKECIESEKIVVNTTKDIIGVQVASAAKNVFAIILGMLDGMKKSDSTRAAVLTCLVNDLRLIIEVLGGKEQTIYSYAGLGDMLLTCMSKKSRNYSFGVNIGKGLTIDESFEKMEITTVEGLYTLKSILKLLEDKQINIKSIKLLYEVIYENKKIDNILKYVKY
ncbi:MAG: NAD(P)H-dependent glycerol-3-phosphate dehydrogenase [Clostridia bacterium]